MQFYLKHTLNFIFMTIAFWTFFQIDIEIPKEVGFPIRPKAIMDYTLVTSHYVGFVCSILFITLYNPYISKKVTWIICSLLILIFGCITIESSLMIGIIFLTIILLLIHSYLTSINIHSNTSYLLTVLAFPTLSLCMIIGLKFLDEFLYLDLDYIDSSFFSDNNSGLILSIIVYISLWVIRSLCLKLQKR